MTIITLVRDARVVELADSLDSGSSVHYARAGSSPASRTKLTNRFRCHAVKTAWHQAFPGFSTPQFYRFQAWMSEPSERRPT